MIWQIGCHLKVSKKKKKRWGQIVCQSFLGFTINLHYYKLLSVRAPPKNTTIIELYDDTFFFFCHKTLIAMKMKLKEVNNECKHTSREKTLKLVNFLENSQSWLIWNYCRLKEGEKWPFLFCEFLENIFKTKKNSNDNVLYPCIFEIKIVKIFWKN